MQKSKNISWAPLLLIVSITATTLVISTWSVDPFNAPKQSVLIITSIFTFFTILPSIKKETIKTFKLPLVLIAFFLIQCLLVLVFSSNNFYQDFYGVFARNNGFITYFTLGLFFLNTLLLANKNFLEIFSKSILLIGFIVIFFGLLQYFSLVPSELTNINGQIVGVFGNMNFQSAFLAFTTIAAFSYIIDKKTRQKNKFLSYIVFVLSAIEIYLIYLSGSSQGVYVSLIGISFVIYLKIESSANFILARLYLISNVFMILFGVLGTLNKGPLAKFLYEISIADRGYCMNAGLNMIKSNPVFGVGFDGYSDLYRLYRSDNAVIKKGTDALCDTAHSVVLDIATFGGLPLLFIYLALLILVIISIIKVVSREKSFNSAFVAVCGVWVGYQVQSVISINQIGIGLWGWILSGFIIGYEISGRRANTEIQTNNSPKYKILLPTIGLVIGLFIGIPNYVYGVKFSLAFKTLDAAKIVNASTSKPYNQYPMWIASYQLLKSNLPKESLIVAQKLVNEFPNSYDGWRIIHSNPTTSAQLKAIALEQMKRLDPLNKYLNLLG
jgi:O-antigen ligase